MTDKTIKQIVDLRGDYIGEDHRKHRVSGNGGFLAPMKKDIGRKIISTRPCITWSGTLGYFADDPKQIHYAFADSEWR